jgi:DNA end-binding protein Ku
MLQPWEKGLLGTTLRYPYEVRDSKDYLYDIPEVKIAPDMLTLAEHILKSKETKFDPSKFVDRYEQAVLQLLEKKQQGMPAPMAAPFVAPTNVVSLMDALRGSIAEDAKAAAPKKAATPQPQKGKKRIAGQVELLLPIAGRKEPPKADKRSWRADANQGSGESAGNVRAPPPRTKPTFAGRRHSVHPHEHRIRPRSLQAIEADVAQSGVRVLETQMHERDAFREPIA